MMFGEFGEDEFEADFEDDERNPERKISFDVDSPSEINQNGGEDGERNKHVVHSFGAGSGQDFGMIADATAVKIGGEGEFGDDGANQDDDGGG